MRSKLLAAILLAILTTLSATAQHKKIAMATRPAATTLTTDPGDLLSTIEFQVQAQGEEAKIFAKGIIPWIDLTQTAAGLPLLLNAGEIVLPYQQVTVVTTLPQPASFVLRTTATGFSRSALIQAISEQVSRLPSARPGAALNLSTADVYETGNGQIILKLDVAS
ncbi:MAG TPA: hypothetical protein VGC22_06340 [Chitinophaga sp.]